MTPISVGCKSSYGHIKHRRELRPHASESRNSLCKPGDRKESDLFEHLTNAIERETMSR